MRARVKSRTGTRRALCFTNSLNSSSPPCLMGWTSLKGPKTPTQVRLRENRLGELQAAMRSRLVVVANVLVEYRFEVSS
jgi:hypothetical protein